MYLLAFGINHRSAPIRTREKFALLHKHFDVIRKINEKKRSRSVVIVSTCNRAEFYFSLASKPTCPHLFFKNFITKLYNLNYSYYKRYFYTFENEAAVKHLYTVTSGLDSMIVGEQQIAGQIKEAYRSFKEINATDMLLNKLFQSSFATNKKVRIETDIAKLPTSISGVAVKKANQIYHKLKNHSVLVLGAGTMSELTCKRLSERGASTVLVASRRYKKAQSLARKFKGKAYTFEKLDELLISADIIITQTSASHYILKHTRMKNIMSLRNTRNLFIIDIAVPRDVEPSCSKLNNLQLYNIDDLNEIAQSNQTIRKKELAKCLNIIDRKVLSFIKHFQKGKEQ